MWNSVIQYYRKNHKLFSFHLRLFLINNERFLTVLTLQLLTSSFCNLVSRNHTCIYRIHTFLKTKFVRLFETKSQTFLVSFFTQFLMKNKIFCVFTFHFSGKYIHTCKMYRIDTLRKFWRWFKLNCFEIMSYSIIVKITNCFLFCSDYSWSKTKDSLRHWRCCYSRGRFFNLVKRNHTCIY